MLQRPNFTSWLTLGLILTAPLNLFYSLWTGGSYVHGLQVDYLILKWYLSDFFLVLLAGIGSIFLWKTRNNWWWWGLMTAVGVGQMLFQPAWALVIGWNWFKLSLVMLAGLALWQDRKTILFSNLLMWGVGAALVFQIALATFQHAAQRPLAPYWLFGESQLTRGIGIVTTSWTGGLQIVPYGSTAHPNILAGFLVGYAFIWLTWGRAKKLPQILTWAMVGLIGWGLFLSQAVAALIGASWLGFATLFGKKIRSKLQNYLILLSLLLLIFIPVSLPLLDQEHPSLYRRVGLNLAGWQLFVEHPILGTGLGMSTTQIESAASSQLSVFSQEVVRFVQPPHHVGLVWLAEVGLVGLGMIIGLIRLLGWSKVKKLVLCLGWLGPMLALDHYMITLQPGRIWLMLIMVNGMMLIDAEKPDPQPQV